MSKEKLYSSLNGMFDSGDFDGIENRRLQYEAGRINRKNRNRIALCTAAAFCLMLCCVFLCGKIFSGGIVPSGTDTTDGVTAESGYGDTENTSYEPSQTGNEPVYSNTENPADEPLQSGNIEIISCRGIETAEPGNDKDRILLSYNQGTDIYDMLMLVREQAEKSAVPANENEVYDCLYCTYLIVYPDGNNIGVLDCEHNYGVIGKNKTGFINTPMIFGCNVLGVIESLLDGTYGKEEAKDGIMSVLDCYINNLNAEYKTKPDGITAIYIPTENSKMADIRVKFFALDSEEYKNLDGFGTECKTALTNTVGDVNDRAVFCDMWVIYPNGTYVGLNVSYGTSGFIVGDEIGYWYKNKTLFLPDSDFYPYLDSLFNFSVD